MTRPCPFSDAQSPDKPLHEEFAWSPNQPNAGLTITGGG